MELARIHRRDPETLEVACWDVPSPNRSGEFSHVMAAACDHADASRLLDPLEEAGLRVVALDARAWAMARALPPMPGPAPIDPPIAAVLDVDEMGSILAVVRAGVVVYDRLMPDASLAAVRARLSKELRVEPDVANYLFQQGLLPQAPGEPGSANDGAAPVLQEFVQSLAGELRSALDFAVHRYPGSVDRVALIGPGASLPGIAAAISEPIGLQAAPLTPREVVECPGPLGSAGGDPGLMAALGLALWRPGARRAAA
jgi:Tfp pilus assembly PilM family ATPase